MVDMMHSSAVYKPNLYFYSEYKKFNILPTGSRFDSLAGSMWAGEVSSLSVRSPRMRKTPDSAMAKTNERLGKLDKIRRRIVTGNYRIDPEKLAEKMLSKMGGLLAEN